MSGKVKILTVVICAVLLITATLSQAQNFNMSSEAFRGQTLAPVLELTTPAVVNIAVEAQVATAQNPLYADPFFRRYFDLPERPQSRRTQSAGSGVIVDARKGYILTNSHVVDGGDRITVTLKDQRQFNADLVGSDPSTDIAVLKIDGSDLVSMPIGDSEDLKVGDFVVAIGNPFGLGQTVTSGMISALGRTGINRDGYEDFIQTDAPINPGNSGGALMTWGGQLIGINTAIVAPSGGNVGIGFAVPSNIAMSVMNQLIEYGEVKRGRLGVVIQDMTPDLMEALDSQSAKGAIVSQVENGSPAQKSGIEAGDIITHVNGEQVEDSSDLRNKVGLKRPGEQVVLKILNDGKERIVNAKLTDVSTVQENANELTSSRLAGARLRPATSVESGKGNIRGLFVESVVRGSPADKAGLLAEDIILSINQRAVGSVKEFEEIVEATKGALALQLLRDGSGLFLIIR